MKNIVVFAILGQTRDSFRKKDLTPGYRPTVALARQEILPVRRIELFYRSKDKELLDEVVSGIHEIAPIPGRRKTQ